MPTYVVLYTLTDQGARNVCATVERARDGQKTSESRGFTIRDVFWTQGRYDLVVIMDATDDETMMAGLLNICTHGNVRSETMRAFTADEMEKVIQRM